MRRVADPHGLMWSVDVSWTDVQFGTRFRRKRAERAKEWRGRADAKAHGRDLGGSWFDYVDIAAVDSISAIVAGVVFTALVVIAVAIFPWLLVLFLDLALILVFPLLALGIIGWRVTRRRPFTITADWEGERVAEWRVVGLREARRVERAVADAIVAGGDPVELFREYAHLH
jgi:hypothetical protein